METIFSSEHPPKTMEIERTDDGQLRLVVSLSKLGQNTILEYFLDAADVDELKKALAVICTFVWRLLLKTAHRQSCHP